MAKVIDITEKLNFEENPKLVIKGIPIEVNADAVTVLKVMGMMNGNSGGDNVIEAYELMFPESSRAQLDLLKLKFRDLMVVIESAISLITDDDEPGEAPTHTTTSLTTGI